MRPMNERPRRKIQTSKQLNIWPAKHLSDAVRRDAARTGKTLTRLVEEAIASRYGLPADSVAFGTTQYPAHTPNSLAMNDEGNA